MVKSFHFALLLLLLLTWSGHAQPIFHDEFDCAEGQEAAVLDVYTDANAEQNGWSLECDGAPVWDIGVGSLVGENFDEGIWLTDSSCISLESTCTFTFFDLAGDGLTGDGFFAFRYGATTVALDEYRSDKAYTSQSACFGPACADGDEQPLERAEDEEQQQTDQPVGAATNENQEEELFCSDDEEEADFDIILDESPQDNGWLLVCDGVTVWEVYPGSLTEPFGSWISEKACVARTATCEFTLTDTAGDGLTANGFYALIYGATTVAASEYGTAVSFDEMVHCFGPQCDEVPLELQPMDSQDRSDNGDGSSNEDNVADGVEIALDDDPQEETNKAAVVAGSVVGGVAAILLILILIWLIIQCKKKKQSAVHDDCAKQQEEEEEETETKGSDNINNDKEDLALPDIALGGP